EGCPVTLFTGSGASPCVCVWFCRPALDDPGWAACPLPVRPAIAAGRGPASAVRRRAADVAGLFPLEEPVPLRLQQPSASPLARLARMITVPTPRGSGRILTKMHSAR